MAIMKKDKENKIAVKPSERKGEITPMRQYDLWSEMDRMFDTFRTGFDDLFWPWGYGNRSLATRTQNRTPPMDFADMGDHYEMKLEMPGILKDDINIEVTPNTIEISAQYSQDTEEKDKNWLRRERSSAQFYRALEVPEELKTDGVDAELKDGVLTLKLPKIEPKPEHKPRKIKIR